MTRSAILLRYILPVVLLLGVACIPDVLSSRQTRLVTAARHGDLAKVKFWLAMGATVNGHAAGAPPLVFAAWDGHDDVATLLLGEGAYINGRDKDDNTALNIAVLQGHLSTVRLFLSKGADPNIRGEGAPLSNAEARNDTPMIELLEAAGATRQH